MKIEEEEEEEKEEEEGEEMEKNGHVSSEGLSC